MRGAAVAAPPGTGNKPKPVSDCCSSDESGRERVEEEEEEGKGGGRGTAEAPVPVPNAAVLHPAEIS